MLQGVIKNGRYFSKEDGFAGFDGFENWRPNSHQGHIKIDQRRPVIGPLDEYGQPRTMNNAEARDYCKAVFDETGMDTQEATSSELIPDHQQWDRSKRKDVFTKEEGEEMKRLANDESYIKSLKHHPAFHEKDGVKLEDVGEGLTRF